MIAVSIRAPVPVEGVVMCLLAEWPTADKLIAAAVALREQAGARANSLRVTRFEGMTGGSSELSSART